jgi:HAD superfamily hydrolase (TIGR01490 family)
MTKTIIAAFDFDGTLTYRDTLIPFLLFVCGPFKLVFALILLTPMFFGYALKIFNRQQVKEALLKMTIGGVSLEILKKQGQEFAEGKLMGLLRPEGMARLQWHQNQGHRCILVSANLDVYLNPWAKITGFHDVVCSKLDVDEHKCLTGKLIGKNCRAHEKVVRLKQLLVERDLYTVYAYGDSAGDKEMLEWADFPYYKKFE